MLRMAAGGFIALYDRSGSLGDCSFLVREWKLANSESVLAKNSHTSAREVRAGVLEKLAVTDRCSLGHAADSVCGKEGKRDAKPPEKRGEHRNPSPLRL